VHAGERDIGQVTVPADPMAMLRSRSYLMLLALAAVIGVRFPRRLTGSWHWSITCRRRSSPTFRTVWGSSPAPVWWPLPVLAAGGVLTVLAIRYLPGRGGTVLTAVAAVGLPAQQAIWRRAARRGAAAPTRPAENRRSMR
jgi:hypothetical protein